MFKKGRHGYYYDRKFKRVVHANRNYLLICSKIADFMLKLFQTYLLAFAIICELQPIVF